MDVNYYLQEIENILQKGSERSHYPTLKTFIDTAMLGVNTVIEEKGNQAGIPDFTVRKNNRVIGYIEAKKISENLDLILETEQLKRYLDSAIALNFVLTNFLEFRWYKNGKLQQKIIIGEVKNNQIIATKEADKFIDLIHNFLSNEGKIINNYTELAMEMATVTKALCYSIESALKQENETGELRQLKLVFQDLLLPDLDSNNFADMYAQTIAYGLFTARIGHHERSLFSSPPIRGGEGGLKPLNKGERSPLTPLSKGGNNDEFNAETASYYLSDNIPFLKGLFDTVISTNIAKKIQWAISLLIELLANADMANILENFGRETKREDPVVHFYETFLSAYSAKLRKNRGVYYTPEPVVYFIVKAVNDVLETYFYLDDGLANTHVNILDPATGTGTFLYEIIKQIYDNFNRYGVRNWHELLKQKRVLKRLFGFELLMTPYTIAHLKLGLLLKTLGYRFQEKERLNIFLTNSLDEGIKKSELLFAEYISQEANQAAEVKTETPINVVIGNPPYAGHSANKGSWIDGLIKDYYQVDGMDLNEKNPKWLQDDYVKFIRFGQWRIEKTGAGILAFVTNHGYLDNPTFRGMRQQLMNSFDCIYLINLHGNAKKKEVSPDGTPDKNVFDIQQGVAIIIAVKDIPKDKSFLTFKGEPHTIKNGIYYYDMWGSRESKYQQLKELNLYEINWETVNPQSPFYLFTPQDTFLLEEYNQGWKITDIMPENSLGCLTKRDNLVINYTSSKVREQITSFIDKNKDDTEATALFNLKLEDKDMWNAKVARQSIKQEEIDNYIKQELYRPFDIKYIFYHPKFVARLNTRIMQHFFSPNYGIILGRQGNATGSETWDVIFITNSLIDQNIFRRGGGTVFPLYLYSEKENGQSSLINEKQANFSPKFIKAITNKLGYTPSPEMIFYYIYAVLHSPHYRQRYAQFLKIDFPRIPLPKNQDLFKQLAEKGEILVNLHLMKNLPDIKTTISNFISNDNLPIFTQEKGEFHYQGDGKNEVKQIKYDENKQQVIINKDCYFRGVNKSLWEFKIGGYQVLEKWLKDRKKENISLTERDIIHYQNILIVLQKTMEVMREIDDIYKF
ncbi:type ISP restriction/modification enzyme [Cyanobacterium aponinum UTEX 3221]|uniref:type ISP restriction/modification enzyme n=1 Tax=Cyanobacterium aponinum TaxID=379064 RepID=UPI002B4C0331|nr:type ISP restriction/modification enzyme [Cyanobacterium aponinum]WRL39629.1 type ISP restriction/modification enzyme [Cyanobacterium aponinum UTEX 3221]